MHITRRDADALAALTAAGLVIGMDGMSTIDTAKAAADRIMARYMDQDVAVTANVIRVHLRTLAGLRQGRLSAKAERDTHEAQAMFGALLGLSFVDQGKYVKAEQSLSAAANHADEIAHLGLGAHIAGTWATAALASGNPKMALAHSAKWVGMVAGGLQMTRLHAISAKAYAALGDQVNAGSSLCAARQTANRYGAPAFHARPFQGLSQAELAVTAVDVYAMLGQTAPAMRIAAEWTPTVTHNGPTGLRNHLAMSHALALADKEPDRAAELMAKAIAAGAPMGPFGPTAAAKVRRFLAAAPPGYPGVRDVATMARSVGIDVVSSS
ncbi:MULTISPECIES: hypothetical protein [unclassified Frankia]|uniref:hypothetical protein n=1 Tax=unclassified Frankia TaxID=2632575 RepID=UPI001EF4517A|nr:MULTISPECIES: hypothetical protein [unclassified Frankia]